VAAASLLALAMMLPFAARSTASEVEVEQLIAEAQVQTRTIDDDLERVTLHLAALHPALRGSVLDAVDSVEAATEEARAALARAADADAAADGTAATALGDAQVALDAASAQLRYVTDLAHDRDSDVAGALERLQTHIDELRGETSRAGS
jgi:ABC-type transporter Mla subunit MlaD